MTLNKIVARFQDGRVVKGHTQDFLPAKATFHVALADAAAGQKPAEIQVAQLKALFFVRDFDGDPLRDDYPAFPAGKTVVGRKVKVTFRDGETLVGTTQGYDPNRTGFFLQVVDPDANNERCFVVTAATKSVTFV